MKKFLLLTLCFFTPIAVSAQLPAGADIQPTLDEQSEQFGELPFVIPTGVVPRAVQQPQPKQSGQEQPDQFKNAPAPSAGLFPELGTGNAEKDSQSAETIYLVINDVTIVQPAFGGIAFCTGTMTVENQMNVTLRQLDVSLRYGSLDVPLSFSSVLPNGGTQTQPIAWAGENCKNMLDVPQMTVLECVAPGVSKSGCESKIKYAPIRESNKIDNAE